MHADVPAPNRARPSAGTVLKERLDMFSLLGYQRFRIIFIGEKTSFKIADEI